MDDVAQQWLSFFNSGNSFSFHFNPIHSNTNNFGTAQESTIATTLLWGVRQTGREIIQRSGPLSVTPELTNYFNNLPDPIISVSMQGVSFPTLPMIPWEEFIFAGIANQNELTRHATNGAMLEPFSASEKEKQLTKMIDMYIIVKNPRYWQSTAPAGLEKVIRIQKGKSGQEFGKLRTWLNPFLTLEQTVEFLYLFQLIASVKQVPVYQTDGMIYNGVIFEQFKKHN